MVHSTGVRHSDFTATAPKNDYDYYLIDNAITVPCLDRESWGPGYRFVGYAAR
jgi:hypothetical protein